MRTLLTTCCYALWLWSGTHYAESLSGWVLFFLGPALVVDRYLFAVLPWQRKNPRHVAIRAVYVVFGAVGYLAIVCSIGLKTYWWEALHVGCALTMLAFLLESLMETGKWPMVASLSHWGRVSAIAVPMLAVLPLYAFHPVRVVSTHTPLFAGMSYTDLTFRASDGVQLRGWLIPHPDPVGCVVFCHGHTANRAQVLHYLQMLRDCRLSVVAFDFRGHGESSGHTCTFGIREVRDVQAAIRVAQREYPDQPIMLMGVSMGGSVALLTAAETEGVAAVWTECAFADFHHAAANRFHWMAPTVREPFFDALSWITWLDCGVGIDSIRPIDRLNQINVPIHFSHGTNDLLVPFQDGLDMYSCYQGPKDCLWVEGANHYTTRVVSKEAYRAKLRQFVQQYLGA